MSAHLLLVEDQATARGLLATGLASAGYRVTEAADGEAALDLLAREPFDVVISDIRMRRVDGIQVLRAARERPRAPSVILLTGYSSVESAIAALRLGAADYLTKPCALADMLACIERVLARRADEQRVEAIRRMAREISALDAAPPHPPQASAPQGPIRVGRLVVDPARRAAAFDGQPIRLTPIEFNLLQRLAESPGTVVGYAAMVRSTHGMSTSDDEAHQLIRSHVHNLRHKIDPAYLTAVRGVGYILAAPEGEG